jgi:zinc protease
MIRFRLALHVFLLVLLSMLVLPPQAVYAQQQGYGITDARTAGGIRLVHILLKDENTQSIAVAWSDRHVLHNIPKLGLQSLAPTLLMTGGSTSLDGGAIEEDLKDLGVQISLRRGPSYTQGEMIGPPSVMNDSARILRMVLMEPRLPPKSLERSKRLMVNGVVAARERTESIASLAFAQLLIGDQPLAALYELETLSRINDVTPADVDSWRKAVLARSNLRVVAAGPMSRADAEKLVDETFGGLPQEAEIKSNLPFAPRRPRMTVVIERPVEQSVILMGHPTTWNSTGEGLARNLAMTVLGGGSSSRLFVAIREKMGAAYGAQAGVSLLARGQYRFSIQSSVANDKVVAALETMRQELKRFREEGVTAAEIDPIKKRMIAGRADAMRKAPSAASIIRGDLLNDQPADNADSFVTRVEAVTAGSVNELIKRHLSDDMLTVIVTPSAAGLAADCVVTSLDAIKTCQMKP